jgi:hypothetical protein
MKLNLLLILLLFSCGAKNDIEQAVWDQYPFRVFVSRIDTVSMDSGYNELLLLCKKECIFMKNSFEDQKIDINNKYRDIKSLDNLIDVYSDTLKMIDEKLYKSNFKGQIYRVKMDDQKIIYIDTNYYRLHWSDLF